VRERYRTSTLVFCQWVRTWGKCKTLCSTKGASLRMMIPAGWMWLVAKLSIRGSGAREVPAPEENESEVELNSVLGRSLYRAGREVLSISSGQDEDKTNPNRKTAPLMSGASPSSGKQSSCAQELHKLQDRFMRAPFFSASCRYLPTYCVQFADACTNTSCPQACLASMPLWGRSVFQHVRYALYCKQSMVATAQASVLERGYSVLQNMC
jgi:hypothetical protein